MKGIVRVRVWTGRNPGRGPGRAPLVEWRLGALREELLKEPFLPAPSLHHQVLRDMKRLKKLGRTGRLTSWAAAVSQGCAGASRGWLTHLGVGVVCGAGGSGQSRGFGHSTAGTATAGILRHPQHLGCCLAQRLAP